VENWKFLLQIIVSLPFLTQPKGPQISPDEDKDKPSRAMPPRANRQAPIAVTGNAYTYRGIQPARKKVSRMSCRKQHMGMQK